MDIIDAVTNRRENNMSDAPEMPTMIHPCSCTSYNGGQCYNCLNGAHDICEGEVKCGQPRSKQIGLLIVVKGATKEEP